VHRGLLWLAVVDLRHSWLRSSLTVLATASAIVAVALFTREINLRQAEILADYEKAGATTFIAEFAGVPETEIGMLTDAIRSLRGVTSVAVPYNGVRLGLTADISFEVFQNEQQQEYLGARTTVLGVDKAFDPARDYYVNFHDLNAEAPKAILGIPLYGTAGIIGAPARDEVVVATDVTNYVGVRPTVDAIVDLIYSGTTPPIRRRFGPLRLVGTFDALGPDQQRFEPFWRLVARDREVLTVRRPDASEGVTTSLPIILNKEVVEEFLTYVRAELAARGNTVTQALVPNQFVIRANSIRDVALAETAVKSFLEQKLAEQCQNFDPESFCIRMPERNNFRAAMEEQKKVGTGGSFFISLLLALIAAGAAGLQIQTVLTRWREFGVLQTLGFSRVQILRWYAIELAAVLLGGVTVAALAGLILPSAFAGSTASFGLAAAISVVAAILAALPALLWPLWQQPAELVRLSA